MTDQGTPPDPDQPDQPRQPDQPSQPDQPDWSRPTQPPAGQGDPGYGQQYGQPQYGQPQYGQPQYGQPQYGQPYGAPYGQPTGAAPPNYLVWAIVTLIACCWPLSIASIVFAAQVNNKFAIGDVAGAQESSRKAKQFAIWSAVIGLAFYGLLAALFIVAAASSTPSTSTA